MTVKRTFTSGRIKSPKDNGGLLASHESKISNDYTGTQYSSGRTFTEDMHNQLLEEIQREMARSEEHEMTMSEWDMEEDDAQIIHAWLGKLKPPFEPLVENTSACSEDLLRKARLSDSTTPTPKKRRRPRIVFGDAKYKRKAQQRRKEKQAAAAAEAARVEIEDIKMEEE